MFRLISSRPDSPDPPMCNLYSQTKSQDAMRHVFDDMVSGEDELIDMTGNPVRRPVGVQKVDPSGIQSSGGSSRVRRRAESNRSCP